VIVLSGVVYKRKAIMQSLKNMYKKVHDKCVNVNEQIEEYVLDKYFDLYDMYEDICEDGLSREEKMRPSWKRIAI
jgi:hypothetical protein